jgi:lipopolysaccharide export LptBFGC system permease protein LptF
LDETGWVFPLLLIALALLIFALGMAQHRYGRTWAQRFVRRPPPELTP